MLSTLASLCDVHVHPCTDATALWVLVAVALALLGLVAYLLRRLTEYQRAFFGLYMKLMEFAHREEKGPCYPPGPVQVLGGLPEFELELELEAEGEDDEDDDDEEPDPALIS